jgi:D-alanine-D-alanine ligase
MLKASAGGCDVAVLVDEEVGARNTTGRFVVDAKSMEANVLWALKQRCRSVHVVPFSPDLTPTIEELKKLEPRLVFNLTEWVDGDRRLDAAITGVLEMMKLRYTGAGPEGMHLARDKALATDIVSDLGVEVAPHAVVNGRRDVAVDLNYPLIVKPQYGDASDGMGAAALVRNRAQLKRRVAAIRRHSDEPLVCEEFVPGRDIYVALLGNEPKVMPPIELVIGRRGAGAPKFATYKVKNDDPYRARWRIHYKRARIADEVAAKIAQWSPRIFHALKLRDYARIDYRLAPDNRLIFLEANPNPDLARDSFCTHGCFAGVPYQELIGSIVQSALAR